MSPRFFTVLIFVISSSFDLTRSWIQRHLVSRCLTLPLPRRAEMPRAAELSIATIALSRMPQSDKRLRVQSTRAAPLHKPYSSASPEERAMLNWVHAQPSKRH